MNEQTAISGSLALNSAPHVIMIPASGPVRTRKLRVAAYARVSSNSEDQLHSFAAQNAYYTELITGNPEWEFVDVYADEGITGTSAEKRDDFQRLLKDCRRGRIDKVLTKSTARFARNTSESLIAVRELRDLGIGVCFEEQGIDTAQMSGELLTAIFSMIAQKESEAISENIRWSIRNRMENGTFAATSLPFGYTRDETGEIKVDLQRAGYVKEIFEAFLSGRNTKEIAEEMKRRQETETPLQSYQWTVHAIARILKNEKYTGNSLWQKSFMTQTLPRRYKVNKGELAQYYVMFRVNGISWWPEELPSDEEYEEARKNLDAHDWAVDYILTHCAPTSITQKIFPDAQADRLTDFLEEVKNRARYHYWLFGHLHDNQAVDNKHILLWEQIVQVI